MSYVGDRGEISAVHVPGGHAPMVVMRSGASPNLGREGWG